MVQALTGEVPGSDIGGVTTNMNEVLSGCLYCLPAVAGIVGLPHVALRRVYTGPPQVDRLG
jgi:hypothetical protein